VRCQQRRQSAGYYWEIDCEDIYSE
jgi:hypothetical protein